MHWKLELALISCAVLGLRHGFDYDHLAALADITAVQRSWREGMRLGFLYACGHALTVIALGTLVVLLRISLPARLDEWTERLIGLTLVVLGLGVVVNLRRRPRGHAHPPLQSRWAIALSGIQYLWWRGRRIFQPELPRPQAFSWNYSGGSVFAIGMLHGVGAETPSQLMLFLLAADLGGTGQGFLGLLAFAFGLILMNALMTAGLGGLFGRERHRSALWPWAAAAGAVYSFVIGIVFILGASGHLPPLGN